MNWPSNQFYQLALSAGQFAQITVEPPGVPLDIELFGPDGKAQAKTGSATEPETLRWVASGAGAYRLAISTAAQATPAGRYKVTLAAIRPATERDRESVAADQLMSQGAHLAAQGAKESRQAALGKYVEALARYRAAEDRQNEIRALNQLGEGYLSLGESQRALEFLQQLLAVSRAIGARQDEAYALLSIGVAYANLGEAQKVLESYQQALALLQAIGDKRGEGGALASLGSLHQRFGRYEQAREFLTRALPLLKAVGDKRSEGVTHNNLGALYRNMGNSPKALEHYLQALPLLRASGDRNVEAITLDNLGVLYRTQGDLPQALAYFNQALSLRRTVGNKRAEAVTLDNLGAVYRRMGEPRKALEFHLQALPLLQAAGDLLKTAVTLNNIGDAQRRLGDFGKAMESHQQAWQLLQSTGDRMVQAATLRKRAEAGRELGKWAEARADIEQAIALLEFVRASVGNEEERAAFFAMVADFYEFNTDLLMQMQRIEPQAGHAHAALQVNEQARARSLLELLSETRANIREGVPAPLLERERAMRQRLTTELDNLSKLLSGRHTQEQRTTAEKEIDALTGDFRKVQSEIRRSSPRYAALTQPQPLSAAEIQNRLLDDDTLLLEYALGEKSSYLWLVSPTSVNGYQLPSRAEIEAAARKVYNLLITRPKRGAPLDPQFIAQAEALSRMLLGPAGSQLGKKRLVIVAPGVLSYLPFASLPAPAHLRATAGNYLPLIATHEIVYLPSASVLSAIRRDMDGRKPASQTIAVLADPVFESNDPRVMPAKNRGASDETLVAPSLSPAGNAERSALTRAINTMNFSNARAGFTRLAFSRREAESIFALASGGTGLKATDFNASRALVMSEGLSQYRVLHFATHGLLNSQHPELSGIVFSLVDREGSPQDGFLRLHEVYNLRLNADLIVLSACETGLGKEIKGEGLIGITRGFMHAGAPRVVASLWNVDDLATAEMMKLFYQRMLKDGLPPAVALRAAQFELSKQKRWASPYFWAGFVLQGEWK